MYWEKCMHMLKTNNSCYVQKNVLYMFAHYLDIMLYPNNKLNYAEKYVKK